MNKTQIINIVGRTEFGRRAAAGFSLVELMVAMVIGLIITFAVVQIFTTSRTTYQTDEGLARVQENGRFAMEFLTREIRQVGDLGCQQATEIMKSGTSTTNPASMYDNASAKATIMTGIQGYEFQNTGAGDTYLISATNPADVPAGWLPAIDTVAAVPVPPYADITLDDAVTGGTGLMGAGTPGSDALVVQRMINIVPATGVQEDQTFIYVPTGTMPAFGPAAITNCERVSFFNISANVTVPGADRLAHDAGNTCKLWSSTGTKGGFSLNYGGTGVTVTPACASETQGYSQAGNNKSGYAAVGLVSTTAFFIAKGASGAPALFQRTAEWSLAAGDYINSNAQPAQELVDGIESMQILYGVDTSASGDGTADTYVTADAVPSWIQVVSVQISLLARSANVTGDAADLTDDTNTYVLAGPDAANGVTIDPLDDKRRRRIFTTTVQLRNRGL
jgi:type IV pilus assembly protein PilW